MEREITNAITLRPNPEEHTPLLQQGARSWAPWSDEQDEERGIPRCFVDPTRSNRNERIDNLAGIDIFARVFLLGRGYALSQGMEAKESIGVPTTPSPFTFPLPSFNEVVREKRRVGIAPQSNKNGPSNAQSDINMDMPPLEDVTEDEIFRKG